MTCHFNGVFEAERLLKLTGSQPVNVSETMQDKESLLLQAANRKWYATYRIAAVPMTLSDLQGHGHSSTKMPAFSYVVYRKTVQQLTRFQLTQCDRWAFCRHCCWCNVACIVRSCVWTVYYAVDDIFVPAIFVCNYVELIVTVFFTEEKRRIVANNNVENAAYKYAVSTNFLFV